MVTAYFVPPSPMEHFAKPEKVDMPVDAGLETVEPADKDVDGRLNKTKKALQQLTGKAE